VYDHYTTNADGCQDTLRLNLTINNGTLREGTDAAFTCYSWTAGDCAAHTESGVYDHYTTNADGCQYTLRLNLTINNGTLTEVTEIGRASCRGREGDGATYTERGEKDHYTTNGECWQYNLQVK